MKLFNGRLLMSDLMCQRFRGYLPVIMDIETSGFDEKSNAILEIAASFITMDADGQLQHDRTDYFAIEPFEGAVINPEAILFHKIDPAQEGREAIKEEKALSLLFKSVRQAIKQQQCKRAILVAHNATFDQKFLHEAIARHQIKRDPFHPFSTFDTATLAGFVYGQTVLAKACQQAGIDFDHQQAHGAKYDAQVTAELFCLMVNRWKILGGWPPQEAEQPST